MPPDQIENLLKGILRQYQSSFSDKIYGEENDDYDSLMRVFGITPSLKRENRQYWGRELGMCWQRLVTEVFKANCLDYQPALKIADDQPCDCILGRDAIDTKYRIGSGDSGTLKKFKQYGKLLQERGLRPILLIVREDNGSSRLCVIIFAYGIVKC
ncbi:MULTISPECIES: restriction endonuclease [unclassified Microcystis]|uniref:restriction endonuclease n=1 Tax=unclassified Microcystis TaxID=2643300 RepID=UPI00257F2C32|nr:MULTISPECIES: restriction endonuclease [unclassified Microcystis]